ncbi:hypothetical protein SAMN05216464_102226 [Mucilaginibacter pineti]|uniref:Uncharacterized protein n=1 Tax=Mucilaginibacter pineti TaxID=1391627 RepID=A0A1G6WLC6_9SPHI|nr:hypothetical protein [Mucilaginibacter pineti]SDD66702.1 hypothetical protein SAMN05216464_102226 [Mucilaginibacter pineti]
MNKLAFLLLLIPCIVFGQKKHSLQKPPTYQEALQLQKFDQCLHQDLFTAKQRRTFFPFNTTNSIKIISFNDPKANFNYLPVKYHIIDKTKVREIKTLSNNGIDSLTDILYNIGYTPMKGGLAIADPGGKCYNPRNAILFIDKKGHVSEYIEFCFQCQKIEFSSEKIRKTAYCKQKFDLLRRYFLAQGIKIGTILETR